jgi:uncharacterized protein YegP (UPF0339 family)
MAGWFELSNSKDGQFRFVLKAGNAETVLSSELYKSKRAAENGIAWVLRKKDSRQRQSFLQPESGQSPGDRLQPDVRLGSFARQRHCQREGERGVEDGQGGCLIPGSLGSWR